jgi:hypothetical protein
MVAYAGLLAGERGGWSNARLDAELDLIGALCGIEQEMREAQWAALERVLPYCDGLSDALIFPTEPRAQSAVGAALLTLGWHRVPPSGCQGVGTAED